jgi:hypothetical protein
MDMQSGGIKQVLANEEIIKVIEVMAASGSTLPAT